MMLYILSDLGKSYTFFLLFIWLPIFLKTKGDKKNCAYFKLFKKESACMYTVSSVVWSVIGIKIEFMVHRHQTSSPLLLSILWDELLFRYPWKECFSFVITERLKKNK